MMSKRILACIGLTVIAFTFVVGLGCESDSDDPYRIG